MFKCAFDERGRCVHRIRKTLGQHKGNNGKQLVSYSMFHFHCNFENFVHLFQVCVKHSAVLTAVILCRIRLGGLMNTVGSRG